MLKWAINEPRQSYFSNTPEQMRTCSLNELHHIPPSSFYSQSSSTTRLFQRQSMESVCIAPDKENQVTSTPLLASSSSPVRQPHIETPRLRKLDSFRDLSNIYPDSTQISTPQRRRSITLTRIVESCYASTLPTLDVNEYSPSCALIPGPLLALRGLGIPDVYFEKPRYLTQYDETTTVANQATKAETAAFTTPQVTTKLYNSPAKSLSSSQMDDSTLERMIDAIIASTHKDHKLPVKSTKQTHSTHRSYSMSPTYTPAYDPASDLDEIWWNTERAYFQSDSTAITHSVDDKKFRTQSSERLLRTPKTHKFQMLDSTFKRRRQRPVRRKRRLTNFRNTVKKSARKLLRVGSNVSAGMPQLCEDDESGTQHSQTNLSPDSGHNSSSGDSSKTEDHDAKEMTNKDANEVEVTKRRLSFSKPHCN